MMLNMMLIKLKLTKIKKTYGWNIRLTILPRRSKPKLLTVFQNDLFVFWNSPVKMSITNNVEMVNG